MKGLFKISREQVMRQICQFRKETSFLLPSVIYIEPTNFCVLKCYMCPSRIGYRKKGMMDIEQYEKVIDDLHSCASDNPSQIPSKQIIMLQGQGSPLMSKEIFRMIRYAKAKEFRVGLDTNGALLDPKKAEEIIVSGIDMLEFSLYGLSKESYTRVHGRDLFESSFRNMIRFLHYKKKTGRPTVNAVSLISQRTLGEVDFMKYLYSSLPVNVVTLDVQNFHGMFEELNLFEELEFIRKREGERIRRMKPYERTLTKWDSHRVRAGVCLWQSTLVYWNGDVTPCVSDYSSRYVVGNVGNENIVDLWNNEKYRRFRRSILKNDYKSLGNMKFCNYCSYAKWIRALWFTRLPRILLSPRKVASWLKQRQQREWLSSKRKHEGYNFLEKHFPLNEEDRWLETLKSLKERFYSEHDQVVNNSLIYGLATE